jgi:DNA-binding MarR family transcriptional regulator
MNLIQPETQDNVAADPWTELAPDGAGLSVHDFLTTRLSGLMTILRRDLTSAYASEFGLSVSEWRLLSLVAHSGSLPFGELVQQSTSDKALVSRTMRILEERGLIEVRPESPTARKRITCAITPKGEALHAQVMPIARRRQAGLLRVLTRAERRTLFDVLGKLRAEAERSRGAGERDEAGMGSAPHPDD